MENIKIVKFLTGSAKLLSGKVTCQCLKQRLLEELLLDFAAYLL